MFFFHMYIAPGRGRQHIGDKIFMTTERPFLFAHMLQVSKWSLRNLIFYMELGPKTPWGQTFDVNRKPLSLKPSVASFKQISLNFDFIHIFLMFFHMYIAPGEGQTTLVDKILMSTEKPCHFAHLLQVSKKYLWSLILYIFLLCFYKCI